MGSGLGCAPRGTAPPPAPRRVPAGPCVVPFRPPGGPFFLLAWTSSLGSCWGATGPLLGLGCAERSGAPRWVSGGPRSGEWWISHPEFATACGPWLGSISQPGPGLTRFGAELGALAWGFPRLVGSLLLFGTIGYCTCKQSNPCGAVGHCSGVAPLQPPVRCNLGRLAGLQLAEGRTPLALLALRLLLWSFCSGPWRSPCWAQHVLGLSRHRDAPLRV